MLEEINHTIQTAPPDWDIIKLDYFPNYSYFSSKSYNSIFSLKTTALLYNRKGSERLLESKVIYHFDHEIFLLGLNVYNNPTILFYQPGDDVYESNNKKLHSYNPLSYFHLLNFNIIRLFDSEYSVADIFLLFIVFCFIILYFGIIKNKKEMRENK